MNENNARNVHRSVIPINVIMPEDIMRHILSFDNVNHHRTVCQQWNRLNKQNEEKMLRDMYQSVDDRNIESLGPNILKRILHPTRQRLHPLEIRLGYERIVSSLDDLPGNARVLVHPGSYRYFFSGFHIEANVQFIGLTSNCQIELREDDMGAFRGHDGKQHFENISVKIIGDVQLQRLASGSILFERCLFEFDDHSCLTPGATHESHSHVFKRCTFQNHQTLCLAIKGSTDVIDCQFTCCADLSIIYEDGAITLGLVQPIIANVAKVRINNNTFTDFNFGVMFLRPPSLFNRIEITNNRFHNIARGYIAAVHQNESCASTILEKCLLQGNTSTGGCPPVSRSNPNQVIQLRTQFEHVDLSTEIFQRQGLFPIRGTNVQ